MISHDFTLLMAGSPGFGSRACDSNRPIQTRFRFGSPINMVNLATHNELTGSFFNRHAATGYTGYDCL
jgi:hypothetical protein